MTSNNYSLKEQIKKARHFKLSELKVIKCRILDKLYRKIDTSNENLYFNRITKITFILKIETSNFQRISKKQ